MDKYIYCVLQLWDSFAFLWGNLAWFSHKCVQADFLTNVCKLIFSQMRAGWFSHKCVKADFLTRAIEQLSFPKTADGTVGQFTLVSRDPKHLFNFSDQYEWGTSEFLSYYLYN